MTTTLRRSITTDAVTVEQARDLSLQVTTHAQPITVASEGSEPVVVPRELADLLKEVIAAMATGSTITIGSIPKEMSTTEAARRLGVSRPTLMKLVRAGTIPSHKVGSHTRLLSSDVLAHIERDRLERRRALDELRELDDEIGL